MGSPEEDYPRIIDEGPQHEVSVTGLWVMRSEVTQGLWQQIMGDNPSTFPQCGSACPVEQVSWFDAVSFANRLSRAEDLQPAYTIDDHYVVWNRQADGYRLLTEAEWEHAALGRHDRQRLRVGVGPVPLVPRPP